MQILREIVLDTETTGLELKNGHRIIEIGCVELIDRKRTGRFFHKYVNPEREIDDGAFAVHGISRAFLANYPMFPQIAHELQDFLRGGMLVIHNASFDVKFLNHEFAALGIPLLQKDGVIDTLSMARKKFPGSPASLDALCRRFNISLQEREKHGALLDAELLASVYMMMNKAVQKRMVFGVRANQPLAEEQITDGYVSFAQSKHQDIEHKSKNNGEPKLPRHFELSPEEREQHEELINKIRNSIWQHITNE
jgi:DNA polymerase III subunit epsilon